MSDATIIIDRAEDTYLPIIYQSEAGQEIDLGTLTNITFEVRGILTISPTVDPAHPGRRIVHITPAQAASLGSKARDFRIAAKSGSDTLILGRGLIEAQGF